MNYKAILLGIILLSSTISNNAFAESGISLGDPEAAAFAAGYAAASDDIVVGNDEYQAIIKKSDIPTFPIWSIVGVALEEFVVSAVESSTSKTPDPDSIEEDDEYVIEEDGEYLTIQCTPNPENSEKQICITIRINKRTGETKITVDGYILLPLKYHIRCDANGVCRVVDDLPWPFRTTFCRSTIEDGKVNFVCDFNYLGFKFKGSFKLYFDGPKLCMQIGDRAPECFDVEERLLEKWRRMKIPYLPIPPAAPVPPIVPIVPPASTTPIPCDTDD